MNKQKVLISSLTVGATSILTYSLLSGNVFAQTNGQYSPLIQRIVEKFNLDQGEVDRLIECIKPGSSQMNKQITIAVEATSIIASTIGFHSGRIFEQRPRRSRFSMTIIDSQGRNPGQYGNPGPEINVQN